MMFRIRSVWTLAVLACTILSTNSFASRRGDLPSSQNGPGPITDCPDPGATPYLAALDGHTTACSTSGGPYTYPNLVATFAGNGYTVVITPVLWMNGGFSGSAKTILQVQVQRPAGSTTTVTINSLALQSLLTNPNYLACDMPSASNDDTTSGTANGNVFGYCMKYRMMTIPPLATTASTYSGFDLSIQEPDPIEFADNTTTRWDFIGFTQDQTFELVADGFPNDPTVTSIISNFGYNPWTNYNTLDLSAAKVAISATVNGKTAATLGSLVVPVAAAAANDLSTAATPVTAGAYTDMKDTAATNPKQGNAATNQNDPVPTCFDGNATTTDSTAIYHSVWYTITPQASGNVTVSTDGSRYDTRAYVFTGTPASPNPVACNDDSTTVSTTGAAQSDIGAFAVTSGAGLTYWIMASEAPKPVGTLLDANGDPVISSGNLVNDIIPSSPHPVLNLAVTGSGLTPSPTSLAFGAQVVNTTSTSKTLTLKATNASLSSIAPSITGDYALAGGTCVSTLSQNSTCTILVTFTPTVLGSRAGTLTVPSSGILGPLKVSLTGTGATVLSTSPISLSFGTVYVGKNATLSGKLTNNSASSLPITAAIAPAGTDFSLGTTTCGASLASHTSCSFQVVFTPTSQRNETASLTYTSGVNKATVSLRGTAMYALALSSKTIAFGTITVNTSLLQTVTLTNNTASPITLSNGISPTGTAFSISGGTCGTTLAAHTACTIGVLFAPKTTGLQSATLNVSGGGYANSATLTGTGQ